MRTFVAAIIFVMATGLARADQIPGTITVQAMQYQRGTAHETGHGEPLSITGGWAEYDVTTESTGSYILSTRYSAQTPRGADIFIDGLPVMKDAMQETTGSWAPDSGQWRELCGLRLSAGKHIFRFDNISTHFTAFRLTPEAIHPEVPVLRERKGAVIRQTRQIDSALETYLNNSEARAARRELAEIRKQVSPIDTGVVVRSSYQTIDAADIRLQKVTDTLARLRTQRAGKSGVLLWASNPLVKHRKEEMLPITINTYRAEAECCRNEHEPLQVCVFSYSYSGPLQAKVSPLLHISGKARLTEVSARFVGYVPVPKKGMWPDPLLLDEEVNIGPKQTQPVWITVKVPAAAPSGAYTGKLVVTSSRCATSLPIFLVVHSTALPKNPGMWVGAWSAPFMWEQLGIHTIGENNSKRDKGFEGFDGKYFAFLRDEILRNRYEHRTRVFSDLINWEENSTLGVSFGQDGKCNVDYTLFDRLVSTVQQAFGGHFRITCCGFPISEKDPDKLVAFFQDMQKHLEQKGWLDKVFFKFVDEPGLRGPEYVQYALSVSKTLKERVPGILQDSTVAENGGPQLEADFIDLPIVARHTILPDAAAAVKQITRGREVWWYNNYMNMIDQSSMHTRMMGWISYFYGFKGYMHWAWDWPGTGNLDPWTSTHTPGFGAGEGFLVYPDSKRKKIVDSIRWELFREMIEDYDTLKMLDAAGGDAMAYCRQLVKNLVEYEMDPGKFYQIRHQMLMELERRTK